VAFDSAHRVQAIHPRHEQVHEHEVWLERECHVDGLKPIAGFTDDLEARVSGENHSQAGARQLVVIDQQNASRGLFRVDPARGRCREILDGH
jgi:hypothetical protein